MKQISIVIPVYNESPNLMALAEALLPLIDNKLTPVAYDWQVVMVNDGSRDNSLDLMVKLREQDQRFNYLNLSRNFGKEAAMLAGLDYATGDAVVIMDADLQHPIDTIPLMIEAWQDGYQDVYGLCGSRDTDSMPKRLLTKSYYKILQKSTNLDVLPYVGDFRLLDRVCVDQLIKLRETQRNTKGLYSWIGYRKKEIPCQYQPRAHGKSSYSYPRLFNLAINGLTSFTTAPLRFATFLGFFTAIISLIYIVFIICKTLFVGEPVQGFPTLMCTILFMGGCQLIAIGIIGEYIGKIYNETKNRPNYLVDTLNGEPVNNNQKHVS